MAGAYQKDYISDDMKYVLSNMTEKSMKNVLATAADYKVPEEDKKITAKTLIVYGSKEEKLCRENTELLSRQIINCQCTIMNGYDHGELAIGNPDKHAEMLRMWMHDNTVVKG